jgi:hypothetical protein
LSFGTNGFLVLRQKNTTGSQYTVHPDATNLANTGTGSGWGSGATSSLAVQDLGNEGVMENSGGTYTLIHNVSGTAPTLSLDVDSDNDGELDAADITGWSILDAIGLHIETDDADDGFLYAPINFGVGATPAGNIPAGSTYVDVDASYGFGEIEYIARWGDSTGQTAADWHASNFTNDPLSGFTAGGDLDFRQSGDPHGLGMQTVVETSQGVAYGTNLTATLGTTNFQNATVTGRRLFYNNSIWDDTNFGFTNASAIAGDKTAYIPNGSNTSTFANMSSYSRGINGIMVELTSPNGTLTAADFTVKMSGQLLAANNTPSTWTAAPAFTVSLVPDTPTTGTDRYELVWADGAIVDRYVYVVVEGADALGGFNFNTGLPTSDYFFFGHKVGDVGSPEFYPNVNALDQVQVRNNQGSVAPPTGVLNLFDFNRDALIDATDQIIARNNQGAMPWLSLTDPPAAPQPAGADDGDAGIAAALAAPKTSSDATPGVLVELTSAAADTGPIAASSRQPLDDHAIELAALDGGIDAVDLDLDDELLDALVSDLSG